MGKKDPKSQLPTDLPIDIRHLLAKQAKKKQRRGESMYERVLAMKARSDIVGGVKGFPVEWLDEEARSKLGSKAKA